MAYTNLVKAEKKSSAVIRVNGREISPAEIAKKEAKKVEHELCKHHAFSYGFKCDLCKAYKHRTHRRKNISKKK